MTLTSGNAVELEVLTREQLQQHCDCDTLRRVWKKDHRAKRPQCLGCTASRFEAFVIVKPWRKRANGWTLIGICKSCSERTDLYTVVKQELMKRFPRGVMIFVSNDPQQALRIAS